ncbi:MAG: hypothetical protein AB7Q17_13230 [Phycisphaerae bacterium]
MKTNLRPRTVLSAAVVVLAIVAAVRWSAGGRGLTLPQFANADDQVEPRVATAEAPAAQKLRSEELPAAWRTPSWPANPFRSSSDAVSALTVESPTPATPALDKPPFVLKATMVGAVPMALVDGRPVGLADMVGDGWVVAAIESASVTLRNGSRRLVLRLPE